LGDHRDRPVHTLAHRVSTLWAFFILDSERQRWVIKRGRLYLIWQCRTDPLSATVLITSSVRTDLFSSTAPAPPGARERLRSQPHARRVKQSTDSEFESLLDAGSSWGKEWDR